MEENDSLNQSNSVDELVIELQKRIGILPVVEPYMFHLSYNPENIVQMLRVQPKSYSEIARTIRAARTMKLYIRGFGDETGGDLEIYGTNQTVVIDCTMLADSPRIEFVTITRKNEITETQGLRILASVRMNELVNYQVCHHIEICQSVDCNTRILGTVVGAITSTVPGLVTPSGGAKGACLADEVICIRIVNCHGDLIEYSSDKDISTAVSTLGILGIVYDVVVRYSPMTLTTLNHEFHKWSNLLDNEQDILKNAITKGHLIEIVYLPYNSCIVDHNGDVDISNWNPEEDEVLLTIGRRMSIENNELDYINSEPRQWVYLFDKTFKPYCHEVVLQPLDTPKLLNQAHRRMKASYIPNPTCVQYTPWAMNTPGKNGNPIRALKYSIQIEDDLSNFAEVR